MLLATIYHDLLQDGYSISHLWTVLIGLGPVKPDRKAASISSIGGWFLRQTKVVDND